jgi:hypothetical protein
MSKKSQRQLRRSALSTASPSVYTPTPLPAQLAIEDFKQEYAYVTGDLRRVGILAGTFFVVLVILAIILV